MKTIFKTQICLFIICLFIFLSPIYTQAENGTSGLLDLIYDIHEKPKEEIINQIYIIGTDTRCHSYFTLVQFYEPNLLIFSYIIPSYVYSTSRPGSRGRYNFSANTEQEKRRDCDGQFEAGTLIAMEVPEELFKVVRKKTSTIGNIKIYGHNWCEEFESELGINQEAQMELSRVFILKNTLEIKKTDGTITTIPIIKHMKFGTSDQIAHFKQISKRWVKQNQN